MLELKLNLNAKLTTITMKKFDLNDSGVVVVIGSGALPVGVLTSFLGAPLFLWLLIRGYRR